MSRGQTALPPLGHQGRGSPSVDHDISATGTVKGEDSQTSSRPVNQKPRGGVLLQAPQGLLMPARYESPGPGENCQDELPPPWQPPLSPVHSGLHVSIRSLCVLKAHSEETVCHQSLKPGVNKPTGDQAGRTLEEKVLCALQQFQRKAHQLVPRSPGLPAKHT